MAWRGNDGSQGTATEREFKLIVAKSISSFYADVVGAKRVGIFETN